MNFIKILIFFFYVTSAFGQTLQELNQKYEEQQELLEDQEKRIQNIQKNLVMHSKRYNTGIWLTAGGVIGSLLGPYVFNTKYVMIPAGIVSLSGLIVIADSHKFFKRAGGIK